MLCTSGLNVWSLILGIYEVVCGCSSQMVENYVWLTHIHIKCTG